MITLYFAILVLTNTIIRIAEMDQNLIISDICLKDAAKLYAATIL